MPAWRRGFRRLTLVVWIAGVALLAGLHWDGADERVHPSGTPEPSRYAASATEGWAWLGVDPALRRKLVDFYKDLLGHEPDDPGWLAWDAARVPAWQTPGFWIGYGRALGRSAGTWSLLVLGSHALLAWIGAGFRSRPEPADERGEAFP